MSAKQYDMAALRISGDYKADCGCPTCRVFDAYDALAAELAEAKGELEADHKAFAELNAERYDLRANVNRLRRALERIEAMPEKDADVNELWEIAHGALKHVQTIGEATGDSLARSGPGAKA